ncbi:hypothetical protein FRC03_012674 [Tulasnella sp. 419]|nr:hypothetical protein FRC03_012674 [Tulasnella sp. 419]
MYPLTQTCLRYIGFSVIFNAEETLRAILSSSTILLYSTLPEPLALVIHWLLRSWPLFRHVLLLRVILMSLLVGTPKLYKGLVLLGTGRFQAVFDSDVDDFVDMIWQFINGGFFVEPNEPTGKTGAGN